MVRILSKFNLFSKEPPMYPAVKEVIPHDDYTLSVVFENGEHGVLDIKPILDFGVFERIRDPAQFARVRVAFDTLEWEYGVDLDPEFVYMRCRQGSST
jgi:hypothetical protein